LSGGLQVGFQGAGEFSYLLMLKKIGDISWLLSFTQMACDLVSVSMAWTNIVFNSGLQGGRGFNTVAVVRLFLRLA
jgi:hypothetical protein